MVLLINCGSKKTPFISGFLERNEVDFEEVSLSDLPVKGYQKQISGCIISGAPKLLTQSENEDYVSRFSFIRNAEFPVLGICFGHQVMGMIYGAKPYLGKPCREPDKVAVLPENSPLWAGFERSAYVFSEDHTEGINLPKGFRLTAYSEDYPVEAMEHETLPLYGVQFHPETSDSNGEQLLGNFLSLLHKK